MSKVLVALSGGVDSGVSALLLKEQRRQVGGLFMRHRYQRTLDAIESRSIIRKFAERTCLRFFSIAVDGTETELDWTCDDLPFLLPADAASALEVAASIGINLTIIDVDVPFAKVVDYFIDRYYSAQTPNPCVFCNKLVKFGLLYDFAMSQGFDFFATGHYAKVVLVSDWIESTKASFLQDLSGGDDGLGFTRIPEWLELDTNSFCVLCSPSPKDQSYFLSHVDKRVLDRTIFPIGMCEKSQVRDIAARNHLSVAGRNDSQEICFIPDRGRIDFIRRVRDSQPERWRHIPEDTSGPFLSLDGRETGRHCGYERFTIGQRKGLGVGFGERTFVQKIDPNLKAVTLGSYNELATQEIRAVNANWHAPVPYDEPFRCRVKIRYRNAAVPATIRASSDRTLSILTDRPCYGVAPGQLAVCYWRDRLLGGATIVF